MLNGVQYTKALFEDNFPGLQPILTKSKSHWTDSGKSLPLVVGFFEGLVRLVFAMCYLPQITPENGIKGKPSGKRPFRELPYPLIFNCVS